MFGRISALLPIGMLMVIVGMSSSHASAETAACAAPPPVLDRFDAETAGQPFPDAPFLIDGETASTLADHQGRGVIVNFWATWCAPCVKEMPALDRLHAELADDGIDVLALSEDRNGAKVVPRFYARNEIANLAVLIDERGKVAHASGLRGLPTTLLVGADGREVGRVVGEAEWDHPDAIAFLRRCLSPSSSPEARLEAQG